MSDRFAAAPVFSEKAVLQRGVPLPVWGRAPSGERVYVKLAGRSAETVAENGRWLVTLPPLEAEEDMTLTVTCAGGTFTARHMAAGEVWLAAGQSNMEFPLRFDAEGPAMAATADDPALRFFDVPKKSYEGQENDPGADFSAYGVWRPFDPVNAGLFSAVGAYFGRSIRRELGVPVGIVGCNWGGVSASAWLPEKRLAARPELAPYLERYHSARSGMEDAEYRRLFLQRQAFMATPAMRRVSDALWEGPVPDGRLREFRRQLSPEQAKILALPVGPMDPHRPGGLCRTMLGTIVPLAVRGVLWYQGESDDVQPGQYARLFSEVVRYWRELWGTELPFLTVQLAPFGRWMECRGDAYPELRRQQELAARSLRGVYLASIMDCGDENDIHPKQKRPVGERLARLALGKVYGRAIACEPPEAAKIRWKADRAEIEFSRCASLFCAGGGIAGLTLRLDGKESPFAADLSGSRLTIRAPGIGQARAAQVQFAWAPFVRANLYNEAGLCAKPFDARRPARSAAARDKTDGWVPLSAPESDDGEKDP